MGESPGESRAWQAAPAPTPQELPAGCTCPAVVHCRLHLPCGDALLQPHGSTSAGRLAGMQPQTLKSKHRLPACPQVDLLQRLEGVMPSHLTSHFFCNSGAGGWGGALPASAAITLSTSSHGTDSPAAPSRASEQLPQHTSLPVAGAASPTEGPTAPTIQHVLPCPAIPCLAILAGSLTCQLAVFAALPAC